jgi:hypothetical protein
MYRLLLQALTATRQQSGLRILSRGYRQQLEKVEPGKVTGEVSLVWSDGKQSRFHNLWLRDNCRCSKCIESSSLQKLKTVVDLPFEVHSEPNSFEVRNQQWKKLILCSASKMRRLKTTTWLFVGLTDTRACFHPHS